MSLIDWYLSLIPGFDQLSEEEKRKYRLESTNSFLGTFISLLLVLLFYLFDLKVLSQAFLIPTITCFFNTFVSLKEKLREWVPTLGSFSFAIAFIISKINYPQVLIEIAFLPILAGLFSNPSRSLHKKVMQIGLIAGYVICALITRFRAELDFNVVNFDDSIMNILLIIEVLSLVGLIIILHNISIIQKNYEQVVKEKSNEILKLESQKHKQKILLKQRDMELLQIENEMKLKVNEKVFKGIKTILNSKRDVREPLKALFLDLQGQIEKGKQINFKHKHIEPIDSKFYDRLGNRFPDLTKSELELCAYLKLQLSNKEIAAMKNVSFNGVNVSKNRLRKKMKLDSNAALSRFLVSF